MMGERREPRRWTDHEKQELKDRVLEYQAQFSKPRRLSGEFYRKAARALDRDVVGVQMRVTAMGLGHTALMVQYEIEQRERIHHARQLKRLARRATYALGTNLDAHTRSEFVQSVKAAVALIEQAYPVDE
jgi:hypothetical protein